MGGKSCYYCVYVWCRCHIKSMVQRKKFLNKRREGKFLKQNYLFLSRLINEANWPILPILFLNRIYEIFIYYVENLHGIECKWLNHILQAYGETD